MVSKVCFTPADGVNMGEMAQWLGAPPATAEDHSLIPRIHTGYLVTACDSSSMGSDTLLNSVCTGTPTCTHLHTHIVTHAHTYICTYMSINLHTHTLPHAHLYMYTHLHAHLHLPIVTHAHTSIYTHSHMYYLLMHTLPHSHTYLYTHSHKHTCAYTYAYTQTCTHLHMHILSHAHTYICTLTYSHNSNISKNLNSGLPDKFSCLFSMKETFHMRNCNQR